MGGSTKNPTYRQVCAGGTGHLEVAQVEFDPKKVSFHHLLDVFFAIHNPFQRDGQGVNIGAQYHAAVFVHSDEQRKEAEQYIRDLENKSGKKVATRVVTAGTFWMAEDYHQQYYLKTGVAACPIPMTAGGG